MKLHWGKGCEYRSTTGKSSVVWSFKHGYSQQGTARTAFCDTDFIGEEFFFHNFYLASQLESVGS